MSRLASLDNLLDDFAARPVLTASDDSLQQIMLKLVQSGYTTLPQPGQGQTLNRWRALAFVSASDLALAKLFEGHTDALPS